MDDTRGALAHPRRGPRRLRPLPAPRGDRPDRPVRARARPGRCTSGNLRTALLAWLFARSAGERFLLRLEDLDPVATREEHVTGQPADLAALGLDWDGPVERQSEHLDRSHAAHRPAQRRRADLSRASAPAARSRRRPSAPHGHEPAGAYPGTCRDLTAAEQGERAGAGRRPALRLRAGGAVVALRGPPARPGRGRGRRPRAAPQRRASRPTTSRWWSTTTPRASTRWCGATTCSARRPGRSTSPACSASTRPATRTCPSSSARRRAAGQAARRGHPRGPGGAGRVARATSLGFLAATLGLAGAGRGGHAGPAARAVRPGRRCRPSRSCSSPDGRRPRPVAGRLGRGAAVPRSSPSCWSWSSSWSPR